MPYEIFELPEYPCTSDMWDELKVESRPILIYGMGNGADKLIRRFSSLGIKFADIFASDGFVRGHSFHGIRVKSFSEVKEIYSDFVIVLSFASNRDDVLSMLSDIDAEFEVYVPDMPVADEEEYFDKNFYNANYEDIKRTYSLFSDEESRSLYASVLNYKLTGKMKYLLSAYSTRDEMYSLFPAGKIKSCVDAGAYNGDTIREAKRYFKGLKKVYAIEPDVKNYKKLVKYSEAECEIRVMPYNFAVWSSDGEASFSQSGNRNSSVSSTASYEHKCDSVSTVSLDSLIEEPVDYIKYDVEGAEREALLGSALTIRKYTPSILVSVYHRSRDVFSIPCELYEKFPDYDYYFRRLKCLPAWEANLIMIPKGVSDETT